MGGWYKWSVGSEVEGGHAGRVAPCCHRISVLPGGSKSNNHPLSESTVRVYSQSSVTMVILAKCCQHANRLAMMILNNV